MRAKVRVSGSKHARIGAIAAWQFGRVSRRQLLDAGLSYDTVNRLVARQALHDLGGGVFAVGHCASTADADGAAALLRAGDGAVLSHQSAAAQWGMGPGNSEIQVIVRDGRRTRMSGARLHRARHLGPDDVRIKNGLPVTSPARTLLDLAGCLSPRQLELALDRALVARLVRLDEVQARLSRASTQAGIGVLKALISAHETTTVTRSEAEEHCLKLIREARLPAPQVNARVAGYEVDFFWPEQLLIVEIDGYRFHSTRRPFDHDYRKDGDLRTAGFVVLRFTYKQLTDEPLAVIAGVTRALATAPQVATISAPSSREMATSTE